MTGYFPFSLQKEFRRKLNTVTTTEEHFLVRRSEKLASRSFLGELTQDLTAMLTDTKAFRT